MSTDLFPVPAVWARETRWDTTARERDYRESLAEPHTYWLEQARRLDWVTFPTRTNESSFAEADFGIRWFVDGVLNVSVNCLDRHLPARADQLALIWEPDEPAEPPRSFTYAEMHREVCRFANVLKTAGAKKGDRITIYMPMIPEAAFALLACARIGAIHSVVFGGFSSEALAGRIRDCDSSVVITADEGRRGGKRVPLKANVDVALAGCPSVERVIVVKATGTNVSMQAGRDLWWHEALEAVSSESPP